MKSYNSGYLKELVILYLSASVYASIAINHEMLNNEIKDSVVLPTATPSVKPRISENQVKESILNATSLNIDLINESNKTVDMIDKKNLTEEIVEVVNVQLNKTNVQFDNSTNKIKASTEPKNQNTETIELKKNMTQRLEIMDPIIASKILKTIEILEPIELNKTGENIKLDIVEIVTIPPINKEMQFSDLKDETKENKTSKNSITKTKEFKNQTMNEFDRKNDLKHQLIEAKTHYPSLESLPQGTTTVKNIQGLENAEIKSKIVATEDIPEPSYQITDPVKINENEPPTKILEIKNIWNAVELMKSNWDSKFGLPKQYILNYEGKNITPVNNFEQALEPNKETFKKSGIKYILQWTRVPSEPFQDLNLFDSQTPFIERNCTFTNCILTKDKCLLKDYTKFDAVVFFTNGLKYYRVNMLPQRRSQHQKFVFASVEPSSKYSIHPGSVNSYFNWTWTYKLNSDLKWLPFVVKDSKGKIVAPSEQVQWIKPEEMLPVPQELENILRRKTKDIAWFDPCTTYMKTLTVWKLSTILKIKYDITIHKFGSCWQIDCNTSKNKNICNQMLSNDYRFYLSFHEINDDFVDNNLLRAFNNNLVPIMLGGANYTRFLPDGSYIDGNKHASIAILARKIYRLVNDFRKYIKYFNWTRHYTIHKPSESPETDHLCKMCELMNDEKKIKDKTVYLDLRSWWNPSKHVKYVKVKPVRCCDDQQLLRKYKTMTPLSIMRTAAGKIATFVNNVVGNLKNIWRAIMYPESS